MEDESVALGPDRLGYGQHRRHPPLHLPHQRVVLGVVEPVESSSGVVQEAGGADGRDDPVDLLVEWDLGGVGDRAEATLPAVADAAALVLLVANRIKNMSVFVGEMRLTSKLLATRAW